jgi:hypothetical protein
MAGGGESGGGWKGPVKGAPVMKGCCPAWRGVHLAVKHTQQSTTQQAESIQALGQHMATGKGIIV